jgi:serine phosphatase RsbU (regulator of sigma subunit)/hemoglobin-like flavoprotein
MTPSERMPRPVDVAAIRTSFDLVLVRSDEFAARFYELLFEDFPDTVPLFSGVDIVRQRKKLFAMLTLVVTHLDRVDVVHPVLRELGRRHVGYGVPDAFYGAFVTTFLKTLGESLPGSWSRDLAESWRTALDQICDVMISTSASGDRGMEEPTTPSDELRLLMEIAGQPQVSAAHSRLFSSFLAKRVHEHDLELAREVQRTLMPEDLPCPDGYAIRAFYEPAREIGGDYYDCMRLDDGRICVAFGDVSGKGIPAALVMARLASAVQTTVQLARSLREGLQTVNDHMCKRASGGRFVTFVALLLDPRSHTVEIVNAGHRAPFLRTADGRVEALAPDVTGVPLGIVEGFEYESERRVVEPGDVIVLFTDGIDEAKSPGGEEYGAERLAACIERSRTESDIGPAVLEEVRAFSAGRPPSDDIALMTVSRSS